MRGSDFFQRFTDAQEIGRDITDSHLSIFYDNGQEVGQWRQDRATTVGVGSVLTPDDAETARAWFARNLLDRNPVDDVPGDRTHATPSLRSKAGWRR